MFAERRIHPRTPSPPSRKAAGSNSICIASPPTVMSVAVVGAASAGGAPSARCAMAAAATEVAVGRARCICGPSARRLPEQHAPRLFGEGGPGVDRRVDGGRLVVGAHGGRSVMDGLEPALQVREILELLSLPLEDFPHLQRWFQAVHD